jgi:hypothetical protein
MPKLPKACSISSQSLQQFHPESSAAPSFLTHNAAVWFEITSHVDAAAGCEVSTSLA